MNKMKLLYKVLAAAAGILALSSCVEDAIAPLTGKYEKPVEYVMTEVKSQSVEKGERTRTFTVELAGSNASLNMKFVGDKYFLHDAAFTAAPADAAKVGNYIVGNGGSTFTLGGSTVNVDSGSLIVAQVDGKYTFKGNLWLADESVVKINAAVVLVYEADPEPVVLTQVLSATSNVASGTNSVTINLGTDGVTATYDPATWSTVYGGSGNYLALDLYSADGFLHEGTYNASAVGGTINEGEFGIGWDPGDLWGIGMVFTDWGTCWWSVDNGATSAEKVTAGTVTVTQKGSKWEIELISGEGKNMLWVKFTGAIDALTDGGGNAGGDDTDYTELVTLISATSNVANGTPSLTLNMATEGVEAVYDAATWSTVYTGTGNYLALDIYSADGKLYTGTYNAGATAGTVADGEFGIGWDPGDLWGIGMIFENWGTCWWSVDNGATSAEKVVDGTVEVAVEGDNLVIKLKSSLVNAKFTYPAADFKDGTGNPIEVVNLGGGDEPPAVDYTELVTLLSATSNVASGTNSLTLNMATEGVEATYDATTWSTVYTGTGNYLALDIYSADGKLHTGTYNACAAGGAIAEGEFGIGWDPGDLWGIGMVFENWGTCWWSVDNGATSAEKVVDGTVEVSVDGANLVIALESALVNARFTYPVADFKDGTGNAIEVI